jgi:hypothetical protein
MSDKEYEPILVWNFEIHRPAGVSRGYAQTNIQLFFFIEQKISFFFATCQKTVNSFVLASNFAKLLNPDHYLNLEMNKWSIIRGQCQVQQINKKFKSKQSNIMEKHFHYQC